MEEVLARGDVREIAGFYDRTDTGDLPREEADDVVIERPELEQISTRLPKEDLDALRRRAAKSGVGYTTLTRMIVRAHLDNPLTYWCAVPPPSGRLISEDSFERNTVNILIPEFDLACYDGSQK